MSIVISKSNLICKNKINRHKQLEYSKFQIYWKKKEISYFELLDRLSYLLKVYNNNPSVNQKLIICPPKIKRDGPKKTIFINFGITCKKLNRTKGHLFSYITGELGTSASIQDGGGLVLKGRYLSKGIENVLRNYIQEYVLCNTCKSARTELQKDKFSKLLFIYCSRCFASRSVNNISKAYFAKLKRKR
jgi:translation initiation factor 2 subunit 2